MMDVLRFQSIGAGVIQQCRQQAVWVHTLSCRNATHFESYPYIYLKLPASACHMHCSSQYPFPNNVQWLVNVNPQKEWTYFFPLLAGFKLLFCSGCQVFPFHKLRLVLWLAVVDLCPLTNDNTTPKGVTFLIILVQEADIQTVTHLIFCELFWNTQSMKEKFVLTNMQFVCQFIDNKFIVEN
jgi:hypothetical protein